VNLGFRLEKSKGHRNAILVATRRFVFGFGQDLLHCSFVLKYVDPFGFRRLDMIRVGLGIS
jgi:hypothetical protein